MIWWNLNASKALPLFCENENGVNYLYGDDVGQSYKDEAKYFERAISQGHTHTKFTFGYSLYYGTDQNTVDKVRGLALMKEAAFEGSEAAKIELQIVQSEI